MPDAISTKVGVKAKVRVGKVTVASAAYGTRAQHGNGSPIDLGITPYNGMMYINDNDSTLWIVVAEQWKMLV